MITTNRRNNRLQTFIAKVTIVFMLTLTIVIAGGAIAEHVGFATIPTAYACGAGAGGGC